MVQPNLEDLQREQSVEQSGRLNLFNQFLATLGRVTPLAQRFQQRQFAPLSGQFALNQILNPGAGGENNFANFLQQGGGGGPLAQGFNQFNALSPENRELGLTALTDRPEVSRNLIQSAFGQQFNPFLRNAASNISNRRIGQFEAGDLSTPIFDAFLKSQQFGGGGGQGFFGGFGG